MNIELVPAHGADAQSGQTRVVTLKVSGPLDPQNPVVLQARELVTRSGSETLLASFELALKNRDLL